LSEAPTTPPKPEVELETGEIATKSTTNEENDLSEMREKKTEVEPEPFKHDSRRS
jgi:hypothetical protein